MEKFTFKKSEKLTSRKIITQLFEKGNVVPCYPYKALWLKDDLLSSSPVQLCITVPKRSFKRAHDRNYIKRKIREAYRKNKSTLYAALEKKELKVALLLIYIAKEDISAEILEEKLIKLIGQLNETIA
jgi:ribonuclease P protein component